MTTNGGDGRQEPLAVETIAVELLGWLVGSGNNHHALIEQYLEQAAEDDRITDVVDEQFIKAQHTDLPRQRRRQGQ
ncbi:hypothetical protein D3C71_2145070 [compost metagenome]